MINSFKAIGDLFKPAPKQRERSKGMVNQNHIGKTKALHETGNKLAVVNFPAIDNLTPKAKAALVKRTCADEGIIFHICVMHYRSSGVVSRPLAVAIASLFIGPEMPLEINVSKVEATACLDKLTNYLGESAINVQHIINQTFLIRPDVELITGIPTMDAFSCASARHVFDKALLANCSNLVNALVVVYKGYETLYPARMKYLEFFTKLGVPRLI